MGVVEQYRAGPLLEQAEHPAMAGGMVADGINDAVEAGAVLREPVGRTDREAGLCEGEFGTLLPDDAFDIVVAGERCQRFGTPPGQRRRIRRQRGNEGETRATGGGRDERGNLPVPAL